MECTRDVTFAKTPKKRAPVKKQASICVQELPKEHEEPLAKLLRLERLWEEQMRSLVQEVACLREAMDHLLAEDSTDPTLSEEELS